MKRRKSSSSGLISPAIASIAHTAHLPGVIPPQLKSIIQKESHSKEPVHVMMRSIEQAKKNELKAYLTLCQTRMQIPLKPSPPSDSI